jgi:glycine/D-amino acid oxidase-like deaminating enzyme
MRIETNYYSRRRFLGGAALAGAALATGCGPRRAAVAVPSLTLPKVLVSEDRMIRTVAGLRPYRPSGFVVRAIKLGDKTIVHNYGHGGGGVTLSWGTASLAVNSAMETGAKRMAVLGSGAVGLATARLLLERGVAVTIYAKDLPPNTTSNIAAAQWFPVTVFERPRIAPEFMTQFVQAAEFAYRRYQLLVGGNWGVRWMSNYEMQDAPFSTGGLRGQQSPIRHLIPRLEELPAGAHPFPYAHVRRFDAMMIDTPFYLEAMVRDIRLAGATIVVRELRDTSEIATLPEQVIVNCTGLGARSLFGDQELTPLKGQLTVLMPQPEVEYAMLAPGGPDGLYMFSRRDGILLGGTHEEGVWDLTPDRAAEKQIVAAHAKFFHDMR